MVSLYQCLNRKNINEEVIKAKAVTSKISERFNLFEYLESFNETFIKCKSQNDQTLEKVCAWDEFGGSNRNDPISCKTNHTIVDVRLTKGDICHDLQFLKEMNYPNDSISYVEKKLFYEGKKRLCSHFLCKSYVAACKLFCISRPFFWLKTTVIITFESYPCHPIIWVWFSWVWNKIKKWIENLLISEMWFFQIGE